MTVSSVNGQINTVHISESYKYDVVDRLTNATLKRNGSTTNDWYQYDYLGNMIYQSINGKVTSYTSKQSNDELTSSAAPGVSTAYSYNPDGTLSTRNVTTTHTSRLSYTWDVPGDLLRVNNGTSVQGIYAYDGQGRRVESIESSSTTFYAYYGTDTLYEKVNGQSSANDYVYASGLRISEITGKTTTVYLHTDALGSTRLVTDSSKTPKILFSDSYQPYGQNNGTPTGTEEYEFTGKPVSQTTGLYYYGARWYDPSTGRFISQDPIKGKLSNPQTLNPYVYVVDCPTVLTDPTGQWDWNPIDAVSNWWNGLSSSQQALVVTIGVDAAAAGAIALTVATCGATAPLAAIAIGAAAGAASSSTIYTVSQGDKATVGGVLLSAGTGAVTGAIGGAGGAVATSLGGGSIIAGLLGSGVGQAVGQQVGTALGDFATGKSYEFDPGQALIDFGIGAVTFGLGSKLGINGAAEDIAANRVYGSLFSEQSEGAAPIADYIADQGAGSPLHSVYTNLATQVAFGQASYQFGGEFIGDLADKLLPQK
jgi:RHS repeat-associated protein